MKNENKAAYEIFQKDIESKRVMINELLDSIEDLNSEQAKKVYDSALTSANHAQKFVVFTIILSLVLTIAVGILISRFITVPIKNMQKLLELVENGDFTAKGDYQSKDEIGQLNSSLNKMIEGVNNVIRTVADTSDQVAAASEELSASAEPKYKR